MAIKGQAPVVPVAISGARDAMRKGSLIIRPVQVTVSFGAPIETAGLTLDDRDELIGTARGSRGRAACRGGADMDMLSSLGRTMGFSFAAGINLYATVAILGLASRFGWVALPPQYQVFDNNWIIGGALALYVVEFVADKIPWVDSVWDAVHTGHPPDRRRRDRGRDARRRLAGGRDAGRAARRHARRQHALQQGRHARDRERQPRALHQLGPEHRRRCLRRRARRSSR